MKYHSSFVYDEDQQSKWNQDYTITDRSILHVRGYKNPENIIAYIKINPVSTDLLVPPHAMVVP